MHSPIEEIDKALDILGLPKLITKADIKKQYHFFAKKYHPDLGGDVVKNGTNQLCIQTLDEVYRRVSLYF